MRPLPTVDPLVRVEAGGRGEGLAAVVAGERPVPSVSPAQICKGRVQKNLVWNFPHRTGGGVKTAVIMQCYSKTPHHLKTNLQIQTAARARTVPASPAFLAGASASKRS